MQERWTPRTGIDYGQVFLEHTYMRAIGGKGYIDVLGGCDYSCLITSKNTFSKLTGMERIHGREIPTPRELDVIVKVPNSENNDLRNEWLPTKVIGLEIPYFGFLSMSDGWHMLHYSVEIVFATPDWLGDFDSEVGDSVFISREPLHG